MAAPVGHIICALAFLNSGTVEIADENAFLVGTNFPDIRYISDIHRSTTHKTDGDGLEQVMQARTPFEAGRRYHVYIDREREKHMREHDAYRFVKNGPLRTQMLKIIEDHILFEKLKGKFNAAEVFKTIHDEERAYLVKERELFTWHELLKTYLDQSHWFNFYRYYQALVLFQKAYGIENEFFGNFWQSLKTLGFFIYAYFQVEMLSRDQELRAIILDFYENKIEKLIRQYHKNSREPAVRRHNVDEPRLSLFVKGFS